MIKKFLPQIERCVSYLVKKQGLAASLLRAKRRDVTAIPQKVLSRSKAILFKKSPSKTNIVPLLDRWLIKVEGEYIFY